MQAMSFFMRREWIIHNMHSTIKHCMLTLEFSTFDNGTTAVYMCEANTNEGIKYCEFKEQCSLTREYCV